MLSDLREEVREQYNKYPYPNFSWFAKVDPVAACHASFEAGSALTKRTLENHEGKKIALLGCGTFEPYAMGTLHSKTRIDAVDISEKSLTLAKRRCFLRKTKNVDFHRNDLLNFCKANEDKYDFINCFGVIHHLSDPTAGFKALGRALNENGFARIMVYSKTQRRKTQLIQETAKLLGLNPKIFGAPSKIKYLLRTLPPAHPLKLSQLLNPELKTSSGTVDSLLHISEMAFGIQELRTALAAANLYIHEWDFSQNLLGLISGAQGRNLIEQLYFLECFDQWPGPYTFWVSKNPSATEEPKYYRTNPHLFGYLREKLSSTVLKSTLQLTFEELSVLQAGFSNPISSTEKVLKNLIASRFLLGVSK
jgi:SAM-dependent methyltransferase